MTETESRSLTAARRKARELREHCEFYRLDLDDVLGSTAPGALILPETVDLEAFDAASFNAWRERMGAALGEERALSYVKSADLLGISDRMAKYYGGAGKPVEGRSGKIPRTVALACEALEVRVARGVELVPASDPRRVRGG